MPRRALASFVPLAAALALTASLVACGGDDDDAASSSTVATSDSTATSSDGTTDMSLVPVTEASVPDVALPESTPTELVVTELSPGTGTPAAEGDTVFVNYVGVRSETGEQFDTNYGDAPYAVTLGTSSVIEGWTQGLVGVTAGEQLQLDIPADLAYGDSPQGEIIQAGDALTFVIDVRAVVPPADPSQEPTAADLPPESDPVTEPTATDLREGDGATLEPGDTGIFHMVYFRGDDQTVLESTWAASPQAIPVQAGDPTDSPAAALVGMKVGGQRALTIPASLAGLTPESDLIIVLDLLASY